MKEKYVLNTNTKTLHIVNCCHHSNGLWGKEFFRTEDEAISKYQNYMKKCKLCFKNK